MTHYFQVDENTFKFDSYADLARDKNIRTIAAQVKQQCFMAKGSSHKNNSIITIWLRLVKMERLGAMLYDMRTG